MNDLGTSGSNCAETVPPSRARSNGMFTYDDEIRAEHGEEAAQIIADLDANPKTKKGYATWPEGARSKFEVEKYLKLRAEHRNKATA